MTTKTKKVVGGSLTNMRKSILAERTTIYAEEHDTTIKTRAWLIERGYIKPGDSQYDARLDPAAVARKAARALSREESMKRLAEINQAIAEEKKTIQTIELRMLEEAVAPPDFSN